MLQEDENLNQVLNWFLCPEDQPFPAPRLCAVAAPISTGVMVYHLEVGIFLLFNIHRSSQNIFLGGTNGHSL